MLPSLPTLLFLCAVVAVAIAPPIIGILLPTPRGFRLKASLYIIVFVLTMSGLICHFLEEMFILNASTAAAFAASSSAALPYTPLHIGTLAPAPGRRWWRVRPATMRLLPSGMRRARMGLALGLYCGLKSAAATCGVCASAGCGLRLAGGSMPVVMPNGDLVTWLMKAGSVVVSASGEGLYWAVVGSLSAVSSGSTGMGCPVADSSAGISVRGSPAWVLVVAAWSAAAAAWSRFFCCCSRAVMGLKFCAVSTAMRSCSSTRRSE